ncbi:UDP-N-acetylmuramoyl-tripeptide--D-alanyl-D-alanine ligase [Candidatus Azambacteria bacterium]|nr:UDP-N-acetylmuramoyl-tripeptide--D-alanyl-D-alanine ligase [Candidatus Azambacteria bacterium]
MMPLKNLLYLLQLEEYDLKRFNDWLKRNPNRVVSEKKGVINWTPKARALFALAEIINILTLKKRPDSALATALRILTPLDRIMKNISIYRAKSKIGKFKNLTVIGITGSYGKTTVKDAVAHLLISKYQVLKTEGNYNTPLGISKTIIDNLQPEHEIFVCEMAAYKPGDIKAIAEIVKPKIGIITAIGPMHFERFGSMENILKTKMELIESLPEDGIGFLPKEMENQNKNSIKFFSSKEDLLVKIGKIFGISEEETLDWLKTTPPTPHRQEIIKASGNITIIDDTYNSNPAGFVSALEALKNIAAERKILVTPGMVELGAKQFELNKEAARSAALIADYIIITGETNKKSFEEGLKEELKENFDKKVFWAADLDSAKSKLSELTTPNSAILLENDLPDNYF